MKGLMDVPGSPPTNVIDPGINPPPKTALSSGSSGIRVRRSFNDPLLYASIHEDEDDFLSSSIIS